MPLVRISYLKGKPSGFGKQLSDIIYRTMTETINVPPHDNFQLITEHEKDHFVYDPGYLGIPRSDGLICIQITLNEGRSVELKKAFYKALAECLHQELGIRTEDVFVNLIEVKKENWSFGDGIAQYAE
jgi:phenylpyruvate tautomerase PptA (4-oxalocrotonate tautomerase family)